MAGKECSCTIEVDPDDCPRVFQSKVIRARKSHRCCECKEVIPVGDTYEYASGIWEDGPNSFHTCMPCKRIRDDRCGTDFIFGNLYHALAECDDWDYLRNRCCACRGRGWVWMFEKKGRQICPVCFLEEKEKTHEPNEVPQDPPPAVVHKS